MSNFITDYFTKELGSKVTNADVWNMVRSKASDRYQSETPKLKPLERINHESIPYQLFDDKNFSNEFFDVLVNRIGTTIYRALDFKNPLGVFKSENFDYGETLQEIYTGLATEHKYNAKDTTSPFNVEDTDITVFYHDLVDERYYERTFNKQWAKKAFISDNSFDEFIDTMFESFLSSDEIDEFSKSKSLLSKGLNPVTLADGRTVRTPNTFIDVTKDGFVFDFNAKLITKSSKMAIPSRTRFENAVGVPKVSKVENQYLFVDSEMATFLGLMLANTFNMDKAEVLSRKVVIDEFDEFTGAGEYNGMVPIAVLIDRKALIIKDKMLEMANIYNPRTLNFNYFLHHHQLLSYSLIENSHIFYAKKSDWEALSAESNSNSAFALNQNKVEVTQNISNEDREALKQELLAELKTESDETKTKDSKK